MLEVILHNFDHKKHNFQVHQQHRNKSVILTVEVECEHAIFCFDYW